MTVKTALRAVSHHCFIRDLRNGPFILYFTDLHQSNIFVDDNWNITKLIDLEWICYLLIELEGLPYWLTYLGFDEIKGDALDTFNTARKEFMSIFAEEAQIQSRLPDGMTLSELWQAGWNKEMFWYCLSITSVNGMYTVFHHICRRFSTPTITTTITRAISLFWIMDSKSFVE